MKTLDEVITELEDEGLFPDALHYLKAYRANQQAYEENSRKAEEARERYAEAVRNCELAENKYKKLVQDLATVGNPDGDHQQLEKARALLQDFYRNDPLTWDELRQMAGKPVWVESQRFGNHWYLNRGIKDESCLYFVGHYGENVLLYDDDMGKVWQAYRKERK